jgi:glycosyltransferase involved in cell wall biosynthesis
MKIWAISCVRNEADLLRVHVLYHLSIGVDRLLILDDGSTDGTADILQELSAVHPVTWRRRAGPFRQAEIFTALAHEAYIDGADWVLPIDADEFWHTPGDRSLRDVLAHSTAGALRAGVVNYVQCREQVETSADTLLRMTRRCAEPIGSADDNARLVTDREVAFVEIRYHPKWISRACATLEIGWGNHYVDGPHGHRDETSEIVCLHAPLRSRAILKQKLDVHRDAGELREYLDAAWHLRRWRRIDSENLLEAEWRANSYDADGLDLYGRTRPLVTDTLLRDLVAPLFPQSPPESARPVSGEGC